MPPKKKEDDHKLPPLIGRVGTNLKCGIVGMPNVGKSTFFNVLTKNQASAENFPFCTIDPNESRVPVPDQRYDFLCDFYQPLSKMPAFLNVTDIAGLVKGASEGLGLGNAFLSHIRECDAIFQVIRIFDDDEVTHIEGEVNPLRDIEIINDELRLKDADYLSKQVNTMEKSVVRTGEKRKKADFETLQKIANVVIEDKKWARHYAWDQKEIEVLNQHLLLTSKPVIYLLNLSEKDYIRKKNKWLGKVKSFIDEMDPGALMIPFSAAFEQRLVDMEDEEQRDKCLSECNATSALCKIIVQGYKALQLVYFFTVGKDEVKAWTIQVNTRAPQAAGKIHTDFEKGFIMAEVMKFDDLKAEGSEASVKAAGKYHQKGRDYLVNDGDIILFKFNTGGGAQGKRKN